MPRKRLIVHSNRLKPHYSGQTTPEKDEGVISSENGVLEKDKQKQSQEQWDSDELLIEAEIQPQNSPQDLPRVRYRV